MKHSIELEQMILDVTQATDPKVIKSIVWNLRQQFKHSKLSYEDVKRLYIVCTTRMDEISKSGGFYKTQIGGFFCDVFLKMAKVDPQSTDRCLIDARAAIKYAGDSLDLLKND